MKTLAVMLYALRRRLTAPSSYLSGFALAAIAALVLVALGGGLRGLGLPAKGGGVWVNAPLELARLAAIMTLYAALPVAALVAQAALEDTETRFESLLFAYPLDRRLYLLGRFGAAFVAAALLGLCGVVGLAVAQVLPVHDALAIGPPRLDALVWAYVVIALPALFALSALFFAVAVRTRRLPAVSLTGVLVVGAYFAAAALAQKLDRSALAGLLDLFGLVALRQGTHHWMVTERNLLLPPLDAVLLGSRLLWVAAGALLLGVTLGRFSPERALGVEAGAASQRLGRVRARSAPAAAPAALASLPPPTHDRAGFGALYGWYLRDLLGSRVFRWALGSGLAYALFLASFGGMAYGTGTWPVTSLLAQTAGQAYALYVVTVIAVFAGELTWREREAGFDGIVDAAPVATGTLYASKVAALVSVVALMQAALGVACVTYQRARGVADVDLGLYARELGAVQLGAYLLQAALAVFAHAVTRTKTMGHVLFFVAVVGDAALAALGLEHRLFYYARLPVYQLSDMNGYGGSGPGVRAFLFHWGVVAVLFALGARVLWRRGSGEGGLRGRARAGVTAPIAAAAAVLLGVATASAAWLWHSTTQVNVYRPTAAARADRARWEREYKAWAGRPQPHITDVSLDVDLEPEQRRVVVRGRYQIVNRAATPIDEILVSWNQTLALTQLDFGRPTADVRDDGPIGARVVRLATPLRPDESAALAFTLEYAARGVEDQSGADWLATNGTFLSGLMLPAFGYQPMVELSDARERKHAGLPPEHRLMPPPEDPAASERNVFGVGDADLIGFEARVRTSVDQTAVAPGRLIDSGVERGRRWFHYRVERPVPKFFAIVSARYAVVRDRWNDVDLEIFHHPSHHYNVERMLAAMRAALAYNSAAFGPYPHPVLRVVEFPRYASFAQSFPTMIPFSEAMGFVSRVNPGDPADVDFPYYVTAHEVAHQWWGVRLVPAFAQGAQFLSESLSQYSALMVMRQNVGPASMRRFLRYELDHYLAGRGADGQAEQPLVRAEQQNYVHYNKGSLALYQLMNVMGEGAMNRVLGDFFAAHADRGAPYPTAEPLLQALREELPPADRPLLADWFETLTLYDLGIETARKRHLPDGTTRVTLEVRARKLRGDGQGHELELPMDTPVELTLVSAAGERIDRQTLTPTARSTHLELVVAADPARVLLDPDVKLLQRRPDDTERAVKKD
ncbi:MAG: hypothetical protein MUF34_18970 [Polyangiaceae bacterium]|nr:hypothetical protein [Polyangiaceae bacterium]